MVQIADYTLLDGAAAGEITGEYSTTTLYRMRRRSRRSGDPAPEAMRHGMLLLLDNLSFGRYDREAPAAMTSNRMECREPERKHG